MATLTASKPKTAAGKTQPRGDQLKTYVWEGVDKRGKKMKGESLAKNENLVKAELRKQGLNPTGVKEKKPGLFGGSGKITPGEIAVFSRQIATMMKSGVPLVQAIEIIGSGHKNAAMSKLLTEIKNDIEGGSALNEALARHPVQFDELFVNLTRAGEQAGVLDTVLDTIASYKENMEALKGKIKKAMFYPAAVIAVAIIVSGILLIFVVPQFESVFANFGAELPAFTQAIVNLSRFMVSYWWAALLIVGGSIFVLVQSIKRSKKVAHFFDRMLLKLPVLGQILHQSAIARFSRTLGLTFRSGVPLVEALETVGGATGSVVYSDAVVKIKDDVSVGYPLNVAMRQVGLFPSMVVQMTAIGEEAGALDTMLFKIAEFYEAEVNNAVDALSSLLEPFIMVIIGGLVGSMVIGMYLPIFKLGAVI